MSSTSTARSSLPWIALLLVAVAACGERQPSPTSVDGPALSVVPVSDGGTVDLLADQDIDVGEVNVTDTRTELTVDIEMQDGWCLAELHIDAGQSEDDIPQTGAGDPIPGQFQVGETLDCASGASRTLALPGGLEIAVAVHAAVERADRVASAWADGTRFVDPGNWATFLLFDTNDPPTATILSPADGATVTRGETVAFEGSGEDEEDGTLTGSALEWSSDLDGPLGSGETVTTNSLTAGTHAITVTATDSEGATDTDEVSITVVEEEGAATLAYVANLSGNSLSVIDLATNAVTTTVALATRPRAVAVTPDGSTVYVSDDILRRVLVLDVATNTVTKILSPAAGNVGDIAVAPDGSTAYVAASSSVAVIDVATNTVTTTIPAPVSRGVTFTPDGNTAYVTGQNVDTSDGVVRVIDVATSTVTTTIGVGRGPVGIAMTPAGNTAYTANQTSNSVSVIDVATNTVTTTIPVGTDPLRLAVTPDGNALYVTNLAENSVSVVDVATNTVTGTIPVGAFPSRLAVTPDGASVYVTNARSNSVSSIDVATNTVTTTIPVGDTPTGIALVP